MFTILLTLGSFPTLARHHFRRSISFWKLPIPSRTWYYHYSIALCPLGLLLAQYIKISVPEVVFLVPESEHVNDVSRRWLGWLDIMS